MPNAFLFASGQYTPEGKKVTTNEEFEAIKSDPNKSQMITGKNGKITTKARQEYVESDEYKNQVQTTFASLYKNYDPLKQWQLNSDLYEHTVGAVGAGLEGASNVAGNVIQSIAGVPDAFSRANAEFRWNGIKNQYTQDELNKTLAFMQGVDALAASGKNPIGSPINNDLISMGIFSLEGINAKETAKRLSNTLGMTLTDRELELIKEYSDLEKSRRKDVFEMDIYKNISKEQGNYVNSFVSSILQKAGYLDEGDTVYAISNINKGAGRFASKIGGVLAYIALQQIVAAIPGVGMAAALGLGFQSQFYETRIKALDKGWSFEDATAIAVAMGAIEASAEYIPLHKMHKAIMSADKSVMNIWKAFAFPEGVEEFVTTSAQEGLENWTGLDDYTLSDVVVDSIVSFMYGALGGSVLGGFDYLRGQIGARLQGIQQQAEEYQQEFGITSTKEEIEYSPESKQTEALITAPEDTGKKPIEQTLALPETATTTTIEEQQQKEDRRKKAEQDIKEKFRKLVADTKITDNNGKEIKLSDKLTEQQLDRIADMCSNAVKNGVTDVFANAMYKTALQLAQSMPSTRQQEKNVAEFYAGILSKPNIDEKTAKALTKVYKDVYSTFGDEKIKDSLLQAAGVIGEKFKALGMTEEQTSILSNFFVNSIFPYMLKEGRTPSDIVESLKPTFINMGRARFNGQTDVSAPSVLDDFSQKSVASDINYAKEQSRRAWQALQWARTGDTRDESGMSNSKFKEQSRISANSFYYGQDEGHKDNTITEQAILNEAAIMRNIFMDMGIASNLTDDDFVDIATLKNKGYSMNEIFQSYGLDPKVANETNYVASANKVVPPLTEQEKASLKKLEMNTRKSQQGGIYDPYSKTAAIGTMAPQGTAVHEVGHFAISQAFYTALDMQSMGIVVSDEMNTLINTVTSEAKKKLRRQPTYTEVQETLAEALVNYTFEQTHKNTGEMNKVVAELVEDARQNHIVNGMSQLTSQGTQEAISRSQSRSAGGQESVYADISQKGREKIKSQITDVITAQSGPNVMQKTTEATSAIQTETPQQARQKLIKFLDSKVAKRYLGPISDVFKMRLKGAGLPANTIESVVNDIENWNKETSLGEQGRKDLYFIKNKIRALKGSKNLTSDVKDIRKDLYALLEGEGWLGLVDKTKEQVKAEIEGLVNKLNELGEDISLDQFVALASVSIQVEEAMREAYAYEYGSNLARNSQNFGKGIQGSKDVDVLDEVLYSQAGADASNYMARIRETYDTTKLWHQTQSLINQFKDTKDKGKFFADKQTAINFFMTTYNVLLWKYPPLASKARELMQTQVKIMREGYRNLADIQERAKKYFENLTKKEWNENIVLNLYNGEKDKALSYAKSVAGEEGGKVIEDMYKFFEVLYNALESAGVSIHKLENYIPRRISKYQEFCDYIKTTVNHPLKKLLDQEELKGTSQEQISNLIGGALYAKDTVDARKVAPFQSRKIKTVSKQDLPFYDDLFDTMKNYVDDAAHTILIRQMFGYAQDSTLLLKTKEEIMAHENDHYLFLKNAEASRIAEPLQKEIDNISTVQEAEDFAKKISANIKGKTLDEAIDILQNKVIDYAESKVDKKKLKAEAHKEVKAFAEKAGEASAQQFGQLNILLKNAIQTGKLNNQDLQVVIKALQSIVERKAASGMIPSIIMSINSVTLVTQMFRGPLSQLETLGTCATIYGKRNTFRAFKLANEQLFDYYSKGTPTLLDKINLPDATEMLQLVNAPIYSKFQKRAYKWSFVDFFDKLQKLTSLIASREYMKSALSDPNSAEHARAQRILDRTFAYDANLDAYANNAARNRRQQVEKDLIAGNITSDVEFFLFNVASDFNPMTILEVSPFYNRANGWGKLFKQFLTPIERECNTLMQNVAEGFNVSRKEGINALSRMLAALLMFGIPIEAIKALLQGKKLSMNETFVSSLGAPFLIDMYTMSMIKKDGLFSGLIQQYMPQFPLADAMTRDLISWASGDPKIVDAQTMRYVPFIGWYLYYHMGAGRDYLVRTNQEL